MSAIDYICDQLFAFDHFSDIIVIGASLIVLCMGATGQVFFSFHS